MKSTTVLLILSCFLLVVDCDPIPGLMDFWKSDDAISPDKTDLELIDHVAVANGPTTTDSTMSLNESTPVEPSSSESGKKNSDMKSGDLFDTSSASSTSEKPSSMEESSSEADRVQSDHHESSDTTTMLPTTTVSTTVLPTTVFPTTNLEFKDSPASSSEEPSRTVSSLGSGSTSESSQSRSEAGYPWGVTSESTVVNGIDNDLDKKEADQADDWFNGNIFETDHQQEDFNNQLNQINPTDASSITSSTTDELVVKVKDELPLNDEKRKHDSRNVNVAGHGSSSASISKGFSMIAAFASILLLLTISH